MLKSLASLECVTTKGNMPRDRLLKRWLLPLTIVRTIVAAIVCTTVLTIVAAIVHTIFIGRVGEILNANTFFKIHSTLRLLNDFTGVTECGRGCSSSRELSITDITVI